MSTETLWKGAYSGQISAYTSVITDQEKYESLWKAHRSNTIGGTDAPPTVDWQTEMVIAVYIGARNTGGYSVTIDSVLESSDQITVHLDPDAPRMDATARPVRVRGTFRVHPQYLHEGNQGPLIALFEIVGADAVVYDG